MHDNFKLQILHAYLLCYMMTEVIGSTERKALI